MVTHLSTAYTVRRNSNIIFVCGGNKDTDLRAQFVNYCESHLREYVVFKPEFAIPNMLSSHIYGQFDLGEFEEIIARLSHAVVIFPEAAGSWAETGYFSNLPDIAKSCILALNKDYQGDSFISLGPARKIGQLSIFNDHIYLNYSAPEFDILATKIRSRKNSLVRKKLDFQLFSKLSEYDLCCLVHLVVDFLKVASIDNVLDFFKVVSKNRLKKEVIRKIISVLVGSKFIREDQIFGYLSINTDKGNLASVDKGHKISDDLLRIELMDLYQKVAPDMWREVEEDVS